MRDRFSSRFDDDVDPMASMGNLVDVMLVFACALIAALLAQDPELREKLKPQVQEIQRGKELPMPPERGVHGGAGLESVGKVYRDPDSGKLIMIGD